MPDCEARSEHILRIRGAITVETRDAATGTLIPEESGTVDNIITNSGLTEIAALVAQLAYSTGFQIGVGTGGIAPAATDTALTTSLFQAAVTSQNASGAVATFKLFLDTTQCNGSTLAEAGLFFNTIMVDHALLSPPVAKNSSKTVTVTVTLTFSS